MDPVGAEPLLEVKDLMQPALEALEVGPEVPEAAMLQASLEALEVGPEAPEAAMLQAWPEQAAMLQAWPERLQSGDAYFRPA